MALTIGIPREVHTGERRVAATPETSEKQEKGEVLCLKYRR